MMNKPIEIPSLHRITRSEWERAVQLMLRAYRDYPKLRFLYPDDSDRQAGIEAVVRYYGAYDMHFGSAFSLDRSLHECAVLLRSEMMDFQPENIRAAACENDGWRAAMQRLDSAKRQSWFDFFEAFDREEAKLDLPGEYIYVDFLAVDPDWQKQGRGRRLMEAVCDYADAQDQPLLLFTNTDEDIRFYEGCGLRVIGVTRSEEFGFCNTYMLRD